MGGGPLLAAMVPTEWLQEVPPSEIGTVEQGKEGASVSCQESEVPVGPPRGDVQQGAGCRGLTVHTARGWGRASALTAKGKGTTCFPCGYRARLVL